MGGQFHTKFPKLLGSTDCDLYAIANLTALTFGNFAPTGGAFDQNELRSRYFECLEKRYVKDFPILKNWCRAAKFPNLDPLVI